MVEMTPEQKELFGSYVPAFEHALVDLSDIPLKKIRGNAILRVVMRIQKLIRKGNIKEALEVHDGAFMELLQSKDGLAILPIILRYIYSAGNKTYRKEVRHFLEHHKIKHLREASMTIAESIRQEGIEEGIEKGIEKGVLQGQAGVVAKQLRLKFRDQVTPYLTKLNTLNSEQLEVIAERLMTMDSIQSVFEGI